MTSTDTQVLILVAGFVAVLIVTVCRELIAAERAEKSRRAWSVATGTLTDRVMRAAGADRDMAMKLLEQIMCDPKWVAGIHAQERIEKERLNTSLDREKLRAENPPPAPPPDGGFPDGVPTDNLDEARGQ